MARSICRTTINIRNARECASGGVLARDETERGAAPKSERQSYRRPSGTFVRQIGVQFAHARGSPAFAAARTSRPFEVGSQTSHHASGPDAKIRVCNVSLLWWCCPPGRALSQVTDSKQTGPIGCDKPRHDSTRKRVFKVVFDWVDEVDKLTVWLGTESLQGRSGNWGSTGFI